MRGVLLAAGFVLGSATLSAQGVTFLEGQVYTPAQLVDGGKYVIKNVADAQVRQGWMLELDNQLRIDVDKKGDAATSLTTAGYVFTAHAVAGQANTYHFESETGSYIHFVGNSQTATTTDEATNITVAMKETGTANGVFNLRVPSSYLNVNPAESDGYGNCVGWNDAGDANGKWEIYAVNGTELDNEVVNSENGTYTYTIKSGHGTLTSSTGSTTYYSDYAMGEPLLTLHCGKSNMGIADDGNLNLYSGASYTLSVPSGWKIVSYSFTFTKAADADITVTPAGQVGQTSTGDPVSVNVEGVNAASTTFQVSANGTKPATFSDFKVVIAEVEPFVADVNKLYRIYNARAVEYMSSAAVTKAAGARSGNIRTAEVGNDFSFLWQLEGDDENGYKLKNLNADGYYVAGSVATVADAAAASVFQIGEGTSNANVTLRVTNNESLGQNTYLNAQHCDDSNQGNPNSHEIGTWRNGASDAGNLWEFSEVTELPLTVSAAGYATVNYPVAVQLPEGVTAYSVSEENDTEIVLSQLTLTDGVLPAGTPVLVAAAQGTYPLTLMPANDEAALETSFNGTTLSEVIADDVNAYILAKHEGDDAAKFYELAANEGDATTNRTLGTNKAYYVANGAAAASFTLRFGGTTTGIDSVTAAAGADTDVYYDLSGRRVLYPTKGIYVKADGTKVILK